MEKRYFYAMNDDFVFLFKSFSVRDAFVEMGLGKVTTKRVAERLVNAGLREKQFLDPNFNEIIEI